MKKIHLWEVLQSMVEGEEIKDKGTNTALRLLQGKDLQYLDSKRQVTIKLKRLKNLIHRVWFTQQHH